MFFFLDTPTPEIYTLSLHDALPISATPTPADSPSAPGAPIAPARGGWWGPALRDRPRGLWAGIILIARSEEHTSELQSPMYLVCRLLLEKKKKHSEETGIRRRAMEK